MHVITLLSLFGVSFTSDAFHGCRSRSATFYIFSTVEFVIAFVMFSACGIEYLENYSRCNCILFSQYTTEA